MNGDDPNVPERMNAAVFRTPGELSLEQAPVPSIGPGELLVRIEACGVCGTDLKKIQYGHQPGPRIFGHEMAGRIAAVGGGEDGWNVGDRVALFHHVSCGTCFYCERGLDAQCPTYKQTSTTAGFEPAGGGFAEFVRVMPAAVRKGVVRLPPDVTMEEAALIEPVNTCLKGVRRVGGRSGDTVVIFGLGSIGLLLALLAKREGYRPLGIDPAPARRQRAESLDISALQPSDSLAHEVRELTGGRGADCAIVATPAVEAISAATEMVRPGGRVVLFANTRPGEKTPLDVGDLCVLDKELVGSYSSSMDL
ncbi:MAG: alcohol dehydrogenase catalytic domain-containing protein, partial [Armatimonadota bacterium]|nr:alcohol dehydrogenase catalytic domain-containing protein [Armatimonadota bacterium]